MSTPRTRQPGRRKNGRFAKRNKIARQGFIARVQKYFDGDFTAAKAYLSAQCLHNYMMQTGIRRQFAFQHPGTPQEFMQRWRQTHPAPPVDIDFYN